MRIRVDYGVLECVIGPANAEARGGRGGAGADAAARGGRGGAGAGQGRERMDQRSGKTGRNSVARR
jgi:hypothetical protein